MFKRVDNGEAYGTAQQHSGFKKRSRAGSSALG